MKTRSLLLASFAMLSLALPSRAQVVAYDNIDSTPQNLYLNEGSLENGDQVTLATPGPVTVTSFLFEYFVNSLKLVGGENLEVRFYDLSGGPLDPSAVPPDLTPTPGAVPLYDSGLIPITAQPNNTLRMTLTPNVQVPSTFVWSVQFTGGNISAGFVAGPTLYLDPIVGSNEYEWWQKNPTWDLYYFDNHQTDFGALITVVPEPGATAVVLLCVAAGTVLVLRRNQISPPAVA